MITPTLEHKNWDFDYSVLSSSKSPLDAPLLVCTGMGSGELLTSLEGIVDGLMSVKVPSSLSNSSLASSE